MATETLLMTSGILVILVLVGIITIAVTIKKRKQAKNKDNAYYAFFVMGISFLPLGIIFIAALGIAFSWMFLLGVVYMALGLANRDKWKNKRK